MLHLSASLPDLIALLQALGGVVGPAAPVVMFLLVGRHDRRRRATDA